MYLIIDEYIYKKINNFKNMDERTKKRAAIYMLIDLVDKNGGNILVNSNKVRRVFNDEDDIVKIEYKDTRVALLADADFPTMDEAIKKYLSLHKEPRYDLYN